MITLETLQAKRGALVAQRRDITAQIGMLDSLIAEAEAMERAATAAAAERAAEVARRGNISPAERDGFVPKRAAPAPLVQKDGSVFCACGLIPKDAALCDDCPHL
jgi:hypothetical protein